MREDGRLVVGSEMYLPFPARVSRYTKQRPHPDSARYIPWSLYERPALDENQELYYPAICRAIAATAYDGYVGQEFTPKGDPIAALEQAYKACDV